MWSLAPWLAVFLMGEIIFGDGFFDCDSALKNAPIRWRWRCVQFGKEGIQLALIVQFEQGFAHHTVEIGVPPLEFVDREFHPFVL